MQSEQHEPQNEPWRRTAIGQKQTAAASLLPNLLFASVAFSLSLDDEGGEGTEVWLDGGDDIDAGISSRKANHELN